MAEKKVAAKKKTINSKTAQITKVIPTKKKTAPPKKKVVTVETMIVRAIEREEEKA